MGRTPCCDKNGLKKGPWTPEEDQKLIDYIHKHGYGNWRLLPKNAGLQRCGKSCRLRWTNYLRPDIKRGRFSFEEEETIIQLHSILGNKWSAIATRLPGRTDNEIKNYWNTHIRKRLLRMGIDPVTHSPRLDLLDLSSLYASSSLQRLLGTETLVNPELLNLASSLFSSQQNSHQEQNQLSDNNHNQIPNSLPFTQEQYIDESNVNPMQYPYVFPDSSFQNQPQLSDYEINASNYVPQLPTNYNNYQNCDYHHHANVVDPTTMSETSTNYYHSNNQNFGWFPSVLSTPSSSPTSLNSNSTYINGSSTEDETESYVSSNILRFEIPDILGMNEFM